MTMTTTTKHDGLYARYTQPDGSVAITPVANLKHIPTNATQFTYLRKGDYLNPELINSVFYWKCDMSVDGVTVSRFTYNTIHPIDGKPLQGTLTVNCDTWRVLASTINDKSRRD